MQAASPLPGPSPTPGSWRLDEITSVRCGYPGEGRGGHVGVGQMKLTGSSRLPLQGQDPARTPAHPGGSAQCSLGYKLGKKDREWTY